MLADSQDFRLGVQHLRAGRLAEAEAIFRRLLAAAPDDADVLHLLGLTLHSAARHEEALVFLTRALPLRRQQPGLHNNIGTVLAALHREPEAEPAFREAERLRSSMVRRSVRSVPLRVSACSCSVRRGVPRVSVAGRACPHRCTPAESAVATGGPNTILYLPFSVHFVHDFRVTRVTSAGQFPSWTLARADAGRSFKFISIPRH